ncbi:two-component sensor histidine kinase [Duganella sp. FT50W]|uniref:histidine kinase n=1 Tax=Duganella lactea TaxID=2692173 RepID=A0A6L8MEW6_9BURK|nr:ATP-binding protein [Duganella lactea]MYM80889.1 two-component sensor histidine kinase [Duganella lactea]
MNRLFRRFALLVLLAMTLASAVIYLTFRLLFGDPLEQIARRQAAGQIFLLEQYIDQAPADEWLPRLNKVREVSEVTLELQPLRATLSSLPSRQHEALLRGELVIDVAGKAYYRRVDTTGTRYIGSDEDVIHAGHLPIDIGEALGMEAIRFAVIALFLLVPIGWWSRRHWRGLQALSKMADDFGHGNLSARADVARSASIAPLAGRINEMADRIAALLEARKHLLHAVSHELRTPIARLEFGMELLRERHAGDDEALQRRLQAMLADVEELKALVEELLSLNQLDHAEAMPRQAFAPTPLLRACTPPQGAHEFNASIADDLGELHGDARLLARAINNLLGNAAKYAQSRITLTATRGEQLHIVVEDDGPGIPADARAQVFEPFYRLTRQADHAAGGYGLGLAIAARAIRLHGGDILIDASPLGGARFTVSI